MSKEQLPRRPGHSCLYHSPSREHFADVELGLSVSHMFQDNLAVEQAPPPPPPPSPCPPQYLAFTLPPLNFRSPAVSPSHSLLLHCHLQDSTAALFLSSVRQASLGIPMLLLSRVLHLWLVVLVLLVVCCRCCVARSRRSRTSARRRTWHSSAASTSRLNRSSCLVSSVSLSRHSDV